MNVSSIGNFTVNKILNLLCNKLEFAGIFLLFIGFFDTNLFELRDRFNTASYGILLFLIILRWKRWIYVGTRDISLLLLISIILLSYFWSAAPEFTIDESKSVVRAIFLGIYLAARYNPKELMQLMLGMFGIAVILNLIFTGFAIATGQSYIAISQANDEPSWQGFLTHKQYLGRMMMHSAILFLLSSFNHKRFYWPGWVGFSLSILLLFLSKSKTSWIGFIVGLSLLPILKFTRWHYKVRTITYIVAVLFAGSMAVLIFGNLESLVVNVLHKSPDFNGRFDIWNLAIEAALKRPWFGYGYAGFWTSNEGLSIVHHTWGASTVGDTNRFHSHNGFIDTFLQLGIIGFSLFIFNFLATVKRIINLIHLTKTIESFWMLEFIMLSFLLQISETLTMISFNTICSIYVAIVLSTIIWQNRIKAHASNMYNQL
ncbi:MAG: O-antigen ligase family protein [Nostoc sp. ChiSLP02]|nr:O-antigen ligase family protein [Nostoc sp. DedSLP05]MDZ8102290.1 O-antigen ligase family protein [Nostoc sp. DedSLP01]MDZ8187295.1 O-antigen ligase family protein [Nostoc sp. ChiSLP02]